MISHSGSPAARHAVSAGAAGSGDRTTPADPRRCPATGLAAPGGTDCGTYSDPVPDDRPTAPLPWPPWEPTADDAGGTGCRHGHRATRSPAVDPVLGFVPSRSNAWFGAAVYLALLGLAWWLLPGYWWWLLVALLLGLIASAAVQWLIGHRGRCWARRSWRWCLGILGALVDPVDQG